MCAISYCFYSKSYRLDIAGARQGVGRRQERVGKVLRSVVLDASLAQLRTVDLDGVKAKAGLESLLQDIA